MLLSWNNQLHRSGHHLLAHPHAVQSSTNIDYTLLSHTTASITTTDLHHAAGTPHLPRAKLCPQNSTLSPLLLLLLRRETTFKLGAITPAKKGLGH